MTQESPVDPFQSLRQDIEKAVVAKAEADAEFRALLKADPHAALKSVLGRDIPLPNLKINVIEEQPGEVTIVLPAPLQLDELPDEMLEFASGGTKFSTFLEYGRDGRPIYGSKNKRS